MKKCPRCNRTYSDETLSFCLEDGTLLSAPYNIGETQTTLRQHASNMAPTEIMPPGIGGQILAEQEYFNRQIFVCRGKSVIAKGAFTENGFIVFVGSRCNLKESKSVGKNIANLRKKMIKEGILVQDGNAYRVITDYIFSSPSTAAGVVLGREANGWIEWKDADGKTLDKAKRRNASTKRLKGQEQTTRAGQSGQQHIKVRIEQRIFEAPTLANLYQQVLRFLCEENYLAELDLPIATSPKRYLLAMQPKHQYGNEFVAPVEYKGYYMEANKSRDRGLRDLSRLLAHCHLSMQRMEGTS